MNGVSEVVLHGYAQISTQCLRRCAIEGIPVHWATTGGSHAGSFYGPVLAAQRKVRQYKALSDAEVCGGLAQKVVLCKIEHQIQHLMRSSRGNVEVRKSIALDLSQMRAARAKASRSKEVQELLGYEGVVARHYFGALSNLVQEGAGEEAQSGAAGRKEGRGGRARGACAPAGAQRPGCTNPG